MTDQKDKTIKNKWALIIGGVSGLISILFFNEFFQLLIGKLFGAANVQYGFENFWFSIRFTLPADLPALGYIIALTSNIAFVALMIELSIIALKKTPLGFYRYSLILFQIINVGYLIVNIFYGAFATILNVSQANDWLVLSIYLGISGNAKIAYMFFVILILFAYLNLCSRRIVKYINV